MGQYKGFYRKTPPPGATKKTSVRHYMLFKDRIVIEFRAGEVYTYSYETAGEDAVEEMRSLAKSGQGLNRYINMHHPGFDEGEITPEDEQGESGSYG